MKCPECSSELITRCVFQTEDEIDGVWRDVDEILGDCPSCHTSWEWKRKWVPEEYDIKRFFHG